MTSPAWARLREAARRFYESTFDDHIGTKTFDLRDELGEALAAVDAEPQQRYSDDRRSLAQEIAETLRHGGHWVPKDWCGPDLITAVGKALQPQQPDEARERAIAEWDKMLLDANNKGKPGIIDYCRRKGLELMRSAPAQQPVPEEPKPCEFCNGSLKDGTDGHGLGECVPVCPTCDGSGSAKPPATSSWLHELAFLGFDPQGCMTYRVNRFGDGADGNPAFHLDFADLQRALRLQLALPEEPKPASPASDWRERFEASRNSTAETLCLRDGLIAAEDRIAAVEDRLAKIERGAP